MSVLTLNHILQLFTTALLDINSQYCENWFTVSQANLLNFIQAILTDFELQFSFKTIKCTASFHDQPRHIMGYCEQINNQQII